jgi:hypothetical protein
MRRTEVRISPDRVAVMITDPVYTLLAHTLDFLRMHRTADQVWRKACRFEYITPPSEHFNCRSFVGADMGSKPGYAMYDGRPTAPELARFARRRVQ